MLCHGFARQTHFQVARFDMSYRPFVERAHGNDDGTAMFDEGSNKEEVLLPFARDEFSTVQQVPSESEAHRSRMAVICLVGLVIFGTFNRIFSKLQTIPMNNYPLAMNLYQCTLYILFYFSYILPTIRFGTAITAEERTVNKRIFATMGALDAVAGIMQLFAFTYISSGALLVLLLQAAIPVSMLISKIMLKTEYKSYHYVGAVLVIGGLVVSLLPQLQHHDDNSGSNQLLWAGVLIASCIPMALGAVYKELELGKWDMNGMYLNGWVALFQLGFSVLLCFPSIYAQPTYGIGDLLPNLRDGVSCLFGTNSILSDVVDAAGKVLIPKDDCASAPFYANAYMLFNIIYNILIVNLLKFGGSNLLYLGMTCLVPIVNTAFSLHFMPKHQDFTAYSIWGLIVILSGLVVYRFAGIVIERFCTRSQQPLLAME